MINFFKNLLSIKSKYTVKFYTGDYPARQKAANADNAICYVEHHFNSVAIENPTTADYAVTIVGKNASQKSIDWGRLYAKTIDSEFLEVKRIGGVDGILIGGYGGRGDGNIKLTNMPAILVEPMFCSNPIQAPIIRSPEGQERLAQVLAYTIEVMFPKGGLVAFSVGHKYKTSQPNDRGAEVLGGGMEADYAEQVLLEAKHLLEL